MLIWATRLGWVALALLAAGAVFWLLSESARGNPRLRIRMAWENLSRRLGLRRPLCETCKWNHPQDCSRRGRPFAMICEDYRRR
jgi:hypothetical protein